MTQSILGSERRLLQAGFDLRIVSEHVRVRTEAAEGGDEALHFDQAHAAAARVLSQSLDVGRELPAFRVHIDISVTDGAGHPVFFHCKVDGLEYRPFEFRLPSSNEWLKISVRFVRLSNLNGGRNSETGRD